MRTLFVLVPTLALLACSGDDSKNPTEPVGDDDDTVIDTDDTTEPVDSGATGDTSTTDTGDETVCLNSLLSRFPTTGSADAFFATAVEFELSVEEKDATIEVSGPSGVVPGTSEVLGTRVRWTPSENLLPETSYTGTLSWSCAPETTTFTTSEIGDEVDLSVIDGTGFRLNLMNGRWLQPAGIGPAIPALLGADILIGVAANGDDLDLTFARSDDFGGPQDLCEPTTAFPTATYESNPLYEVGPADVDLQIDGAPLPVYDLELSGGFASDGSVMEGGRLAGLADLSPLSPLLVPGSTDPTAICGLLAKFLVACFACPDGGDATCVPIEVDSIRGVQLPVGIETRTPATVANDPTCN